MPRLLRRCADCPEPTSGIRCAACDRAYRLARHRADDAGRPSRHERGYDAQYERDRLAVIGGPCELRLPGCTGIATTADHVLPRSKDGVRGPLRGACLHCNSARGNRELPSDAQAGVLGSVQMKRWAARTVLGEGVAEPLDRPGYPSAAHRALGSSSGVGFA